MIKKGESKPERRARGLPPDRADVSRSQEEDDVAGITAYCRRNAGAVGHPMRDRLRRSRVGRYRPGSVDAICIHSKHSRGPTVHTDREECEMDEQMSRTR